MIKICSKHYHIKAICISDFFDNFKKDILLRCEKIFEYFVINDISLSYEKIYVLFNNKGVNLYFNNMLIYTNPVVDDIYDGKFTECYKRNNKDNYDELERSLMKIVLGCIYAVYSVEKNVLSYKVSKRDFYSLYKIKGTDIQIQKYELGAELISVSEKYNKIKAFINYTCKKIIIFPSKEFPSLNKEKLRWFSEKNTEDLPDQSEVDAIIGNTIGPLGKCFDNAATIIELLYKNGYDKHHVIEYYAGWFLRLPADTPIYHAWVVIDGKSILDMGNPKYDFLQSWTTKEENGECSVLRREEIIKLIKADEKVERKFSDRYSVGKVRDCLYVGSLSSRKEAGKFLEYYLNSYKRSKIYNKVDEKGFNKLQQIYNKQK